MWRVAATDLFGQITTGLCTRVGTQWAQGGDFLRRAIFLDRDGVINENRSDYVKSWDEVVFLPGVFEPLRRLANSPFVICLVTNQSVINRGIIPRFTVEEINQRLLATIRVQGGRVDGVFYCPHRPDERCDCRKPRPGLLLQAQRDFGLDLSASYLIGDAVTDIEAARSVGSKPILVLTGLGQKQLPVLRARGEHDYRVAADLRQAVDLIFEMERSRVHHTITPQSGRVISL